MGEGRIALSPGTERMSCIASHIESVAFARVMLVTGSLAFALHAVPYAMLVRRLGRRWRDGVLLGVPPVFMLMLFEVGESCPGEVSSGVSLFLICALWLSGAIAFFALLWRRFVEDTSPFPIEGAVSAFLAVPVLGPAIALAWLGLSLGLPELLGIRRGDSQNPPNFRGRMFQIVTLGGFVIVVLWELFFGVFE